MIAAVVPAQNEEGRITKVLDSLSITGVNKTYVVINGSNDNTLQEVLSYKGLKTEVIYFRESLGIDVPRAVGAWAAYDENAEIILFVDGDMVGNISNNLIELINCIKEHSDMALTNCYPSIPKESALTSKIISFRKMLNQTLGVFEEMGITIPSHGPHAVSRKFLKIVPFRELAVPPVSLAIAVKEKLKITVPFTIPHFKLGSKLKDKKHAYLIAETIIGDCIEAMNFYKGNPRERIFNGIVYDGYNSLRRWDILDEFLKNKNKPLFFH